MDFYSGPPMQFVSGVDSGFGRGTRSRRGAWALHKLIIVLRSWQGVAQIHFLIHVYHLQGRRADQGPRGQPESRTKSYGAVLPEREAMGKSIHL